jgi:eukaryotic-like serine/threonine-protein kinase
MSMAIEPASDFIDALADEFLRQHRRGERPRIAHFLSRYPEHAEEIREVLPGLVMLESLAKRQNPRSRYSLLSGVRRPEVLGDYRILQEVGQGGMGIVYEAEQISLGRHVALKVLPFQLAGNPRAVERFQREARAAANLQHPHIVPVFDFGQEDAVWYYAMQFVHGQPVSEVLDEVRKLQGAEVFDLARWAGQTTDLAVTLLEGDFKDRRSRDDVHGGDGCGVGMNPDGDREVQIRAVIDDCLQRSERGEHVCHEEILEAHPDLRPELEEELHLLRLVQASRMPSFVEDLAAMEARWAPSQHATDSSESASADEPTTSGELVRGAHSHRSAVSLTGEQELTPANRKRYYFQSVARLGADVAGALAYAHEQGVIHRDVKPSNLMLDTRGGVWITDFGLAKLDKTEGTSTNGFVGTLRYMSPEQMQGQCDERTDVYGLGMTLYEMLTLRLPFEGLDHLEVIHKACHQGPTPPREIDPLIPGDLETIILTAIARDAADRYPAARALAEDLNRFLSHQPIAAQRSGYLARSWKWLERNVASWFRSGPLPSGPRRTGSSEVQELRNRVRELEAELAGLQHRLEEARRRGSGSAATENGQ